MKNNHPKSLNAAVFKKEWRKAMPKKRMARLLIFGLLLALLAGLMMLTTGCVTQAEIDEYIQAHPELKQNQNTVTQVVTADGETTTTAPQDSTVTSDGETAENPSGTAGTTPQGVDEGYTAGSDRGDISPDPIGTQPGETGASDDDDADDIGLIGKLASLLDSRNESLQIIGLLTVLSLAPSILIMFTSFVRIIIVLSFTRNALGLQQMPPNQVLVGLALFLTFFVMSPVLDQIKTEAYIPYVAEAITLDEAVENASEPIKNFMLRQTRTADLELFYAFADEEVPETVQEVKLEVLTPAYLISELRRGFEIGFFIYIPFIVIDMIVSSVLMAMGMMMLPPVTISLPFKVLLFVVVDGWAMTVSTLLASFG